MNFGGTTSEEDSIKLLDEAYKNYGINFFVRYIYIFLYLYSFSIYLI